jgi:thiol-disulfide isomerase/thioredoxin
MPLFRLLCAGLAVLLTSCSQSQAVPPPADDPPPARAEGPDQAETAEAFLAQAMKAAQAQNLDETARQIEKALKVDPKHRQALLLRAMVEQIRGSQLAEKDRKGSLPLFLRSAEAMRTLRETYKDLEPQERALLGQALYNEACALALQDKPAKALAALAEANEAGIGDLELLDTDDDLAAVRKLPEFAKFRKDAQEKAKAHALDQAKELLAESKPFPFAFTLPDLEGQKASLADLKGRVTIVDVWGTWCPPCRKEIPHFVELYKKYHDRGLAIVGINYEQEEDDAARKTIREFVKENGLPYPCLIGDEKTREQIPDFEGFPTTLFLGPDGAVRLKVVGYHSLADLEAIITTLLEEAAPGAGRKK